MKDIKYKKIFGIYSLVLPIILVGLFFFVVKFGTTISDVVYRPYGKVSDFISLCTALIVCPILILINIFLFFPTYKQISGYKDAIALILIANIILCFQLMGLIGTLWMMMALIIIGPGYIIAWFIYLIYFIINYKKFFKEEGQAIPDKEEVKQ